MTAEEIMIQYLLLKVEQKDWHGVSDAANDLRETEYLVRKKKTGGRNWTPLYEEPLPCPTCQSLARAVMMDQTGKA